MERLACVYESGFHHMKAGKAISLCKRFVTQIFFKIRAEQINIFNANLPWGLVTL